MIDVTHRLTLVDGLRLIGVILLRHHGFLEVLTLGLLVRVGARLVAI